MNPCCHRCKSLMLAVCRCIACILLLVAVSGCTEGRSTSDYVPSSNQARQAVEQMLEAWRSGDTKSVEFQAAGGPKVQIFDQERSTSKKLAAFEIVREVAAQGELPRQIAVKLTFDGDPKEVETSYFVVGIDPLLLFRDADYRQASGMK